MVKSKADNITPAGFRATVGKYGGDNWSMVWASYLAIQ